MALAWAVSHAPTLASRWASDKCVMRPCLLIGVNSKKNLSALNQMRLIVLAGVTLVCPVFLSFVERVPITNGTLTLRQGMVRVEPSKVKCLRRSQKRTM